MKIIIKVYDDENNIVLDTVSYTAKGLENISNKIKHDILRESEVEQCQH